ncbi:SWIM zinc finger family protein [Deinococcus altitudinis]|uniref:SWIM zinc finger family protein n=1 Tax=Deinococcus altitudinis TaxID=468914 RepID=UPI003891E30B
MLALAPDASSAQVARKLTSPAKWPTLNASPEALWGECQGSGSKPYLVGIDLRTPEYACKCSCPSRKFPCKHGLALLLLHVGGQGQWGSAELPETLQTWLDGRQTRQERAAQTEPAPEKTADPAAKAKREKARAAKVTAGLAELHLWLQDLIREGLHAARTLPYRTWDAQAARLIDAQVSGAARLVRQIPDALQGEGGETLLVHLGKLALLCEGWTRRDSLEDPERLQLLTALGQPLDTAALLAGEGQAEEWTALGFIHQSEGKLEVRRTWLRRSRDGQMAALLDFAVAGRGFPAPLPLFFSGQLDVRLVPTLYPQRALLAGVPEWSADGATPVLPPLSVADLHRHYAAALALNPWLDFMGCTLGPVWLLPDPPEAHDLHGHAVALRTADVFLLMAYAEGKPAMLLGEWNGRDFEVISVMDALPLPAHGADA